MDVQVGDRIQTRKPHPCGCSEFEVLRIGMDFRIRCTKCGREIRHLATKGLEGVGFDFPHRFVADWYDWQNAYISSTDLSQLTDQPVYEETVQLSKVHVYKYKELLNKEATVRLYGDRITLDDRVFPLGTVSAVVVLGKNKVNIYDGQEILQLDRKQQCGLRGSQISMIFQEPMTSLNPDRVAYSRALPLLFVA